MAVVHVFPIPAAAHPISALMLVLFARSPCATASIATLAIPCAASLPPIASTSPLLLVSPWAKTTALYPIAPGAAFGTTAMNGMTRTQTNVGVSGSDQGPGGVMSSGLQLSPDWKLGAANPPSTIVPIASQPSSAQVPGPTLAV